MAGSSVSRSTAAVALPVLAAASGCSSAPAVEGIEITAWLFASVDLALDGTECPPSWDQFAFEGVKSQPWFSRSYPAAPQDGVVQDYKFFSLAPGGNTFIHLDARFDKAYVGVLASYPYLAMGIEIEGNARPGTFDFMTDEWLRQRRALEERDDWKTLPEFEGWDEEDLAAGPPTYVWDYMEVARRRSLKILTEAGEGDWTDLSQWLNAPPAALPFMRLEHSMGPARLAFCEERPCPLRVEVLIRGPFQATFVRERPAPWPADSQGG